MDGFNSNLSPDRRWNLLRLFHFRKLGHFSSSLFLPRSKTGENFGCSWPRAKFFSPQSARIDAVWGWEIIHEKIAKIFNLNLSSTLSERTCKSILLWIIPKRQTQVFSVNFFSSFDHKYDSYYMSHLVKFHFARTAYSNFDLRRLLLIDLLKWQ